MELPLDFNESKQKALNNNAFASLMSKPAENNLAVILGKRAILSSQHSLMSGSKELLRFLQFL